MTETKMNIYNFDQTSQIPPIDGEPTSRDGYKWVAEKNTWEVDISQSQTKRFEIMLAQNPNMPGIRSAINKERQLDGFEQVLTTPPKPGEDTIIWIDGYQRIWNPEKVRWDCPNVKITDPLKPGEASTRREKVMTKNSNDNYISIIREYNWNFQKKDWTVTTFVPSE